VNEKVIAYEPVDPNDPTMPEKVPEGWGWKISYSRKKNRYNLWLVKYFVSGIFYLPVEDSGPFKDEAEIRESSKKVLKWTNYYFDSAFKSKPKPSDIRKLKKRVEMRNPNGI
jgi:hypothetical protein